MWKALFFVLATELIVKIIHLKNVGIIRRNNNHKNQFKLGSHAMKGKEAGLRAVKNKLYE